MRHLTTAEREYAKAEIEKTQPDKVVIQSVLVAKAEMIAKKRMEWIVDHQNTKVLYIAQVTRDNMNTATMQALKQTLHHILQTTKTQHLVIEVFIN